MAIQEPTTQTLTTADVSRELPTLVQQVSRRETRVLVAEDGKPLAALISVQDLELLDRLHQQRVSAWKVFEEIWSRNGDRDPDEVERDMAAALAEVRDMERAPTNSRALIQQRRAILTELAREAQELGIYE